MSKFDKLTLSGLALSSLLATTSLVQAEAVDAASAIIGKNTTITVGWPGCKSEAVFNQLNSLAESGDTTAFLKFSFDNRATGECMVLPVGLKVRVEKVSQQHVCVRPEGRKAIAELKRQEAETAERVAEVEADAVIVGALPFPEAAERAERRHEEAVERKDSCFWIELNHTREGSE